MDFDSYVAARGQHLLRLARLLVDDSHAAEDLVQSTLLAAYRHWKRVRAADYPDAYVRQILINSYLRTQRRRSSTEIPVAEVETEDASPTYPIRRRRAIWHGA